MKTKFFVSLHLFLVLVLAACSGVAGKPSQEPTTYPSLASGLPTQNEVKELLIRLVDTEQRAPGIVIGMISADPAERWVIGYGKLGASDPRIPDGDTVFEIASMSKVFTGTLLALAVQSGEVQLTDPISKYLPPGVTAPEYKGIPITLLDLATHTSGLPYMPDNFDPADRDNIFADYTMEQMYSFLSSYELPRQPGTLYEYSNYGMSLLGHLLARRANEPDYEALMVDRICNPLGMDSTRIQFTPEMESRLAIPHNSVLYPVDHFDLPAFAGGGGIRSTANDLLKFLAANMGSAQTELLPAMQLANTSQRPTLWNNIEIGLAWHLQTADEGVIHWHSGQMGGFHTYIGWDPDRRIGVVVMANSFNNVEDIGFHLLHSSYPLVPHQLRILPSPVSVSPEILASYAGTYKLSNKIMLEIRVDGTRLFLHETNRAEVELFARSDTQFYQREANVEITFHRNASGEVDHLTYVDDTNNMEVEKVP